MTQKPTLLILAAGMASRYGSLKQVDGFGPNGETIIDYSMYDAIRAGFGKIVFVIRAQFAESFKSIFEPRLKGRIATEYVFQELSDYMHGKEVPADRTKPWGTAHAVLCGKSAIHEPFAVINADDYYGREAFEKMAQFLQQECNDHTYSVVGYELGNTLSENGSVSRGVCAVNEAGNLAAINERTKIERENGVITFEEADGSKHPLEAETPVSMNFWGFHPSFFDIAEDQFRLFIDQNREKPKAEFFIPLVVDHFISSGKGAVKVIPTATKWFGVTYKEDAPGVKASLEQLIAGGAYPENLWK
ncbi:nucleotidyltransferase family protein [Compostibacter hankyongensis]|uniref:Nucleotidyltransferase n=1 Tax=Compostibacter hankyongensis TaxID=1007089 RepID=A0ABP8GAL8_9BACT